MLPPAHSPPDRVRPLARREYDHLVELGHFADERLELLRGALVTMSPQRWQHAAVVEWLTNAMIRQLPPALSVRTQLPFVADEWSEPEPDLAVVRADPARRAHPSEVLLIIEVADTSLRTDRDVKRVIYAEAKVPEYWVVDLAAGVVTVHTEPRGDTYDTVVTRGEGDVLRPTLLPTVALPLTELPR